MRMIIVVQINEKCKMWVLFSYLWKLNSSAYADDIKKFGLEDNSEDLALVIVDGKKYYKQLIWLVCHN